MRDMLETWRKQREERREQFISMRGPDQETASRWQSDWAKHDSVIYELTGLFPNLSGSIPCVLEAGWEFAKFNLLTNGNIAPYGKEKIDKWALDLWERIHQECGIAIVEMQEWHRQIRNLWSA